MIDLGNLGIVPTATTPAQAIAAMALAGRTGRDAILSQRQRDIAKLMAQGCPHKEIAHRMRLTEGTVKFYLWRLYSTGWTRAQLILYGAALTLAEDAK